MVNKGKISYPVTKKTLHKYAKDIFGPIQRGECVTTVWVPMAGRRMWNKFIIENIDLFKKELSNHDKYLLVYIEPLDLTEESMAGYLRLMGKSFIETCQKNPECKNKVGLKSSVKIFDDESSSYSKLLTTLRSLASKAGGYGFRVVFFMGEFDELGFANKIFFNNLKSLWSGLYPIVHYVFLMRERVVRTEKLTAWGEFNEAILQNIVYIPLRSEEDVSYLVQYFSREFATSFSKKEVEVVKKLCGGHPYMIRVAFRVFKNQKTKTMKKEELENLLYSYYELQSVARGVFDVYDSKEKKILGKIVRGEEVGKQDADHLEFLKKLRIVTGDKKYRLFGRLFEETVRGSYKEEQTLEEVEAGLKLEKETDAIFLNGQTIEEKFSRQEYSVLKMFLEDTGKLKSRDDIGDILWGKESYEKYSDWAIDQLVCKLRKKLSALRVKDKLITVRRKGYKYIKPAP